MSPNDRDVVVDDEGRPREKRHRTKGERGERSERSSRADGHHHRSRKSRSSKSQLSEPTGSDVPSGPHSSTSHRRRRRRDEGRENKEDRRERYERLDREDRESGLKVKEKSSSMAELVPEVAKTAMSSTDRVSVPYPSFSKAHSKEAIHSREDVSAPFRKTDPLTPEHTDLGSEDRQRSKSADYTAGRKPTVSNNERPPSPPETELTAKKARSTTPESAVKKPAMNQSRSRASSVSGAATTLPAEVKSHISVPASATSSQGTAKYAKSTTPRPPHSQEHLHPSDAASVDRTASKRSVHDPGITTVEEVGEDDSSPTTLPDSSSPKTPTNHHVHFPPPPPPPIFPPMKGPHGRFPGPPPMVFPSSTPGLIIGTPAPPPPPPPPLNFAEAPRVDYLLQNGGLTAPAPRHFLSVLPRNGTRPSNPPLVGAQVLFAPFFNLLEQYNGVLGKQGSIAVATGHRSVARRLLDRLEHVFSRDLPDHGCSCIICEKSGEEHHGLNWGEVLEWVSGRGDLPQWPPFDLAELGAKAVEPQPIGGPPRPSSPIKMDPDIAEEFREHYLRQSKKVRHAVDKWLNNCAEAPAPPPTEVDDETLSFAILTNLDTEERPFFNALFTGAKDLQPALRAPTPFRKPRTDFLVRTGLALQRLHRLERAPRDAETAMYLIKNRDIHDLLATISDITPQEWEILTSGRFDGFLWSGAEDDVTTPTESRGATPASGFFPSSRTPARNAPTPGRPGSRMTTPLRSFSRGSTATPASFISGVSTTHPKAVSNDEEAEIAALAELEREIYTGMEALEDAFESLHRRAEEVRTALRTRGAGLMQSMQSRRHINVYGAPSSGNSLGNSSTYDTNLWNSNPSEDGGTSESDWCADDFELMPDDSASNISSSRHRRPKRRSERRTPAPIEELEEG